MTGLESYWQSVYSSSDLGPRPDDALLSVCLSLARANSRRKLKCSFNSAEKILEISSYYRYDVYVVSFYLVHNMPKTNLVFQMETISTFPSPDR